MKTFEDCKNEIAKLAGYKTWYEMENFAEEMELSLSSTMWQQAADLYADYTKKEYAIECVKLDRDRVFGNFNILKDHSMITGLGYLNHISEIHVNLSIELP